VDGSLVVGSWLVVLAMSVVVAAVQIVPTSLHIEQSIRRGGLSLDYAGSALVVQVRYLPQLFFPYAYTQGDWLPAPDAFGSEFNYAPNAGIYAGSASVLLAAAAWWWVRRRRDPVVPLTIGGALAVALALGDKTPLFPLLRSLPALDGFRYPNRFLLWASFCFGRWPQ
jgi:hypothetical protein